MLCELRQSYWNSHIITRLTLLQGLPLSALKIPQTKEQINHFWGVILLGLVVNGKSEPQTSFEGSQEDLNLRHGHKILELEGERWFGLISWFLDEKTGQEKLSDLVKLTEVELDILNAEEATFFFFPWYLLCTIRYIVIAPVWFNLSCKWFKQNNNRKTKP